MADPQPDNAGGCMLALYPPPRLAKALAVPGGLPPEEIHLTIAYAGKAADVEPAALKAVARKLASRDPVNASISGHARFTGGDTDVIVALADGPGLEDLRRDAMDLLGAQGVTVPRDHGYVAHLSLRYADPEDADPVGRLKPVPVTFAGIAVVHGKKRTDYPFGGDLAAAAREAHAAGWALSAGPMTERVEASCEAAVALALESRHDPRVLEVSLHLGHLAGTWATVYERREGLTAKLARKVSRQWRKAVKGLDPLDLVTSYRRALIMREAAGDAKPSAADTATAKASSLAWLQQVLSSPQYADLATEIADAIIASMAEGKTAALAVAADQAAALGFDWARAYAAMYAGLTDLANLPELDAPWAQAIIAAAGADAGKTLAAMAAAGASDEEIAGALWGASADDAVMLAIDTAISGSMARGALDLYLSEGVLTAWLTAGDGRVCFSCQDNEDQGPYDPSAFPACPDHPRCVIGSTRIAVPGVAIVTADVDGGLSRAGIDLAADSAPAAAPAGSGRDFGRGNIRAVSDREYVGDVVTIRTALGYELTATPNHPVATRRGWVPIAELAVGDHVLASTRPEWVAQGVDPDVDDVPPRIEQVAETFAVQLGPMPTAPEDFHGDGAGSEVHVVRADRLLVNDRDAGVPDHAREHQLSGRRVPVGRALPLNAERPGDEELRRLGLAANGVMGGAGEPRTLLGTGLGHAQVHGVTSPARRDPGLEQPVADDGPADSEGRGERLLALAGEVTGGDLLVIQDRNLAPGVVLAGGAHRDSCADKPAPDGLVVHAEGLGDHSATLACGIPGGDRLGVKRDGPAAPLVNLDADRHQPPLYGSRADAEGFTELLYRLAPGIAADEIVDVKRDVLATHVYNLETVGGYYISNGILTHNCRCTPTPASPLPLSAFADFLVSVG